MMNESLDSANVTEEYVRFARQRGIEAGDILPMNEAFQKVRPEIFKDFAFVDFTYLLVKDLFPPSEAAVVGIIYKERLDDLWRAFSKKRAEMLNVAMVQTKFFSPDKPIPIVEFELHMETNVTSQVSETEYETLKFGKKKDRKIQIYAQPMFDEHLRRGLIFGILTKST
jgi:hypothetical protein